MAKAKEPSQIEQDAREFGLHVKQGGWRLGLLVARNVEKGTAGRPTKIPTTVGISKISAEEFARQSDTSAPRVRRFLDAWQKAAKEGCVPAADTLSPGTEVDLNVDSLPNWSDFYDASKAGGRPRDSRPEDAATIINRASSDQIETIISLLPDETKKTIGKAVISAGTGEIRAQLRAAMEKQDAADVAGFHSETKAKNLRRSTQKERDGANIARLAGGLYRVISAARSAAEMWTEIKPALSEEASEVAFTEIGQAEVRVNEIFRAMLGDDLESALAKILDEVQG